MAWLAVNKDGTEKISEYLPIRENGRVWGFDMNNDDAVWKALNAVAGKIYYEGSVDGESNLAGKAEIAEGLTASSASAKLADMKYKKDNHGQGYVEKGSAPNPNPNPATQPSDSDGTGDGDARDQERLEDLKSELENLIQTDPVLMQFHPQLLLDMTPEGLRVQIIDRDNRPMFATGSAQVQPYMRDILRELGPIFNELPNTLSISGHTDSTPFLSGGRSYGNWELSGDRANSARRELISGGMDQSKVKRVLGLADTVSLVENPADAMNRRISIIVLNRKTERLIDQQNQSLQPGTPVQNLTSPTGVVPAPVIPAIPGLPAPAATP